MNEGFSFWWANTTAALRARFALSAVTVEAGEHHTGFVRCFSARLGRFFVAILRLRKRVVKVLLMGVSFGGGGPP